MLTFDFLPSILIVISDQLRLTKFCDESRRLTASKQVRTKINEDSEDKFV